MRPSQNSAYYRCGTLGGGLEVLSPALAGVQDRTAANSPAEDRKENKVQPNSTLNQCRMGQGKACSTSRTEVGGRYTQRAIWEPGVLQVAEHDWTLGRAKI